ncbi:hypothetical protein F6X40_26570 [Paraburkholderia sp. UCT31]|uniref:DUF799 domain-containing protein n=1 Tax=unclassified Paraburkholderia TaxID=2615204 RepID=UPI0021A656D0|nr:MULTISPECIES: DUF799 domain-containing protein [unclassified Paraburkholderia]MBC8740238.1 hypothetical protein [Paraburkholderia sp. UCT31]
MFGADSIMYVTIIRWDAKYAVLATSVTVELSYALKSGTTAETLWTHRQTMVYSPQAANAGNKRSFGSAGKRDLGQQSRTGLAGRPLRRSVQV